jgi:two-component system CheB/CheR fusion protein
MPNRHTKPVAVSTDSVTRQDAGTGLRVVGIGASAGGLEAATHLMDAIPADIGMAFILVQHLDPGHESMMVELLTRHTAMTVCQATQGMPIEPDHLYVIPPGTYLSIGDGHVHLSAPPVRHGARLPFDFLLHSLARTYGSQAACVVLSGTGADGSIGLIDIKAHGGLVLAQKPEEASYDGMPRSAIATGAVEAVLAVADIPAALIAFRATAPNTAGKLSIGPDYTRASTSTDDARDQAYLANIVELLRTETIHDFSRYKPGTLLRRVQRRMALFDLKPNNMARYEEILNEDGHGRDLLAKDLLINVTSFFRDGNVFDHLAATIIPELLAAHDPEQPFRLWVAGCSTGEETYSLAMLFTEQIASTKPTITLQIFASDIDAEAVGTARDGVYPETIASDVSPERLQRFFVHEDGHYRVIPSLRGVIVFTVHDLLSDPPFSRLDMVSCRNLLIYLRPDAQAKVISLFHFALHQGGILLLGSAETVVDPEGRFDIISKPERLYRRIGRSPAKSGSRALRLDPERPLDAIRRRIVAAPGRLPTRPTVLADLGRRLVIETYAPAAILINAANETLFSLGPTDRYLRLPPGHATHDLLAMARPGLRAKLRAAIETVRQTKAKLVAAGRLSGEDSQVAFSLEVFPVLEAGEEMLLICFVEAPQLNVKDTAPPPPHSLPRLAELERELDLTRAELLEARRDLEQSLEDQKASNEEALSVNEEYQSTNEELLTSKEELQSLNEELTALNSQLQETLERQRTTADDLQNILYSTNVATLFLDRDLKIRFFTPATKSLFAVLPSDIGRPLADLAALTTDGTLAADCRTVLDHFAPLEHEFETADGTWFRRRILPYRTHGDQIEGVVITFTDVTARINIARALEAAKNQAEVANATKSRFLAAASHDLRQPLQTLALLQALLAKVVSGEKATNLVARFDETLTNMIAMLDTLLDINEIEAGAITPHVLAFPVNDLLSRLRDEFATPAEAKGLVLHVEPCGLTILSDPRLLEQMIRNLLSNALKYTAEGRVLVGCRRRAGQLRIEVWDTGIGIPAHEIAHIFEEYRQVDNAARERSRGLGLGLSIVKRLSELLGHRVTCGSAHGSGSHFAVEVPLAPTSGNRPIGNLKPSNTPAPATRRRTDKPAAGAPSRGTTATRGAILIIEDDPDLRNLLRELLADEGYPVVTAADGPGALAILSGSVPSLVLADFNLPNGQNGLALAGHIRRDTGRDVPVVILTGDASASTRQDIADHGFVQLTKPVTRRALMDCIARQFPAASNAPLAAPAKVPPAITPKAQAVMPPALIADGTPVVYVVDDEDQLRDAILLILEDDGRAAAGFATAEAFLGAYRPGRPACLLVDAALPGISGVDLLERLHDTGDHLPAIMITGQSDVPMAVRAMKAGAADFIEKPIHPRGLLDSVNRAFEMAHDEAKRVAWREDAARHVADLTPRQRQIMRFVLAGHPSKNIAADLGISQRTVENHRASIMRKTGSTSLPALARLALAAEPADREQPA